MCLDAIVVHGIGAGPAVLHIDRLALVGRCSWLLDGVQLWFTRVLFGEAGVNFVLLLELLLARDHMSARMRFQLLSAGEAIDIVAAATNRTLERARNIIKAPSSGNNACEDGVLFCEVTRKPRPETGGSARG